MATLASQIGSLQHTVATQASQITKLHGNVISLSGRITSLSNSEAMKLNQYLTVTTDDDLGPPLIRFTGANLQVVNGTRPAGNSNEIENPPPNALGNLIIGYNEQRHVPEPVAH